jgi:hypothetical protein
MKMWSGPACVLDTADEDVDLWMKKVPRCDGRGGAELSWRLMVIQPWEAPVEAQRRDCKGGGRRRARVRKSGTTTWWRRETGDAKKAGVGEIRAGRGERNLGHCLTV